MTGKKAALLKGNKPSSGFQDYIADALATLGKIETKRVFGLHGVKAGGVLLGFIIDDQLFLRTDDASKADYVTEGMQPFTFTKQTGEFIVTSYFPLPDWIYDDPDVLVLWARKARAAALEAPRARKRRDIRARRAARELRG